MTTSSPQVLIVEDEAPIRRFLRAALMDEGYRYNEAQTGKEGLKLASTARPDIVLLDLGLPDLDGLEVIRQLREWSKVPIIVLSARGQEADKVRALDAGANDYLTKPFGVGELLARLRVALRVAARDAAPQDVPVFETADFRVDLVARRVVVRGSEVHLTPIEYRLLTTLIRHAGKVLTHRYLLKEVWGPDQIGENHYLRVFMANLRRKLEAEPARPKYLITEPGIGYRLSSD